jgi:hypothetical protein
MVTYSDEEPEVKDGEQEQENQGYEEGLDDEDDPDPYNEGTPPTEAARSKVRGI